MQIFITRSEEKSGPFTLDQVREHLEQGVLLPDDLAFHDGLDDWIPLSELMDSVETALDGATENAGGKKKLFIGIGATVVVLAIAAVVWFILGLGKNHKRLVWEFATEFNVGSSPAIGADGTVYIGSSDKKVYALDGKTGAKKWEFVTGGKVESAPAIGVDGTVYIGSFDGNVYAIKTDSKGLAKSPWPMRGQNAQHTGRAP